jgi:hypothetical protein
MSVPPCPWCQAKPMTVRAAHGRSERTFCPACYRVAVTVGGECNSRERWSEAVAEILASATPIAHNCRESAESAVIIDDRTTSASTKT